MWLCVYVRVCVLIVCEYTCACVICDVCIVIYMCACVYMHEQIIHIKPAAAHLAVQYVLVVRKQHIGLV